MKVFEHLVLQARSLHPLHCIVCGAVEGLVRMFVRVGARLSDGFQPINFLQELLVTSSLAKQYHRVNFVVLVLIAKHDGPIVFNFSPNAA